MLETIIAAQLPGIDAFERPVVEAGKVLAKRYLTGGARALGPHRCSRAAAMLP
jgi:hypothetical protein